MPKATAPLDLLREFRVAFEHDAKELREREKETKPEFAGLKQAFGARALAAETAVKRIDATLRDWA